MKRNISIDFIRGICMMYIVGIFHLSQYLGEGFYLNNNMYGNSIMWSCLGTFSLISGFLIGSKYRFAKAKDALDFYKRRIIRFYSLFLLSSVLLCLIGFNSISHTIYGLLGISSFGSFGGIKTLWYISMIMFFYLITPLILRGDDKRIWIRSIISFIAVLIVSRLVYIDLRFIYNLFLYLAGISLSTIGVDKALNDSKKWVRWTVLGGGRPRT